MSEVEEFVLWAQAPCYESEGTEAHGAVEGFLLIQQQQGQHTLLPAVFPLPIPENSGKAQVLRVHSSQNPEEKAAKAEG